MRLDRWSVVAAGDGGGTMMRHAKSADGLLFAAIVLENELSPSHPLHSIPPPTTPYITIITITIITITSPPSPLQQDYHLPVEGGRGAKPRPLHVVHVAVEMAPIAKVRGMWWR